MTRLLHFSGLSVVTLLLSACATLTAPQGDLDTRVDHWVEEHRYDQALEAMRAVPPDHPGFNGLAPRIQEVEQLRGRYIAERLQQAAEHEPEGNWPAAIAVLDEALERLPGAPELQSQRDEYERRRQLSIQRSQRDIQLAYGRYLLATRPAEEKLLLADPNGFFAKQRYRSYQQELDQASRNLYALGRQALYEDNSSIAVEALTLSNRLVPNELSEELLYNIQQAERQERQRQREQEAAAAQRQWPQLESEFELALRLNDLLGARRLIGEMRNIDAEATEPLSARLDERIDAEAAALLERGRLLYGQGLLQEALAVWREALQLKPDDPDLLAAIERAETFLDNLDRWGE